MQVALCIYLLWGEDEISARMIEIKKREKGSNCSGEDNQQQESAAWGGDGSSGLRRLGAQGQ